MNRRLLTALLLAATVAQADITPRVPGGWERMVGRGPDRARGRCDIGIDEDIAKEGRPNMTVRCVDDVAGFGGLNQGFSAEPYRGKRVRLSAMLKSRRIRDANGVEGVGSLWFRVEAAGQTGPFNALIRDNGRDRGVRDTQDWTYVDAVAVVPVDAERILIGVWMQGRGQVWISDIRFEEVVEDVPVNTREPDGGPRNLGLQ